MPQNYIKTNSKCIWRDILDFNFSISCLPTWSENNVDDLAYIWYLVVAGGLLPTAVMGSTTITLLYTMYKVCIS